MVGRYKAFPAEAAWCNPNGTLTLPAMKALGQIVRLFGGTENVLPDSFTYTLVGAIGFGYVYAASDGTLTTTGAATNGQLLVGRTGLSPVLNTLTGTANRVTVSNGSGTITLTGPQDIHTAASPTFADVSLTALTARSFLYSGAASLVSSTAAATNGQLLVGSTGSDPVAASLTGTANQITVTNGAGSITLSLPQNIAVGSSPTFTGLTLSGLTANAFTYSGTSGAITSTAAPTNGQLLIGSTGAAPARASITGTANQVVVTNGAGSITLSGPQDLATTSSPTFVNETLKHLIGGSSNPSIAAGAGAGTGPTVAVVGTDLGFRIDVTTGTLPTLGATIATVTFANAYGAAPHIVPAPANANTALLSGATMVYGSSTTTTYVLTAGPTALTAATAYSWECIAVQ